MNTIRRLIQGQRGLTLAELVVVAAIMGVLAALTAVALTGTTSSTKGVAKITDESEVTKAAGSFAGTHGKGLFPVTLDINGTQKTFTLAGSVANTFGLGSVDIEVYEIDWNADDGTGKKFSPGYIAKAKHADDPKVDLDGIGAGTTTIGVWIIMKSTGIAAVLVQDKDY